MVWRMIGVLTCITTEHDLSLVALAALVCLFASYTAIELLGQACAASGRARLAWAITTGTVAGAGIWATHFIAMLAFKTPAPVFYDISLTAASIMVAVALASFGIAIVAIWSAPLVGGLVLGLAIELMHYTGMAALRGPVAVSWDTGYVAASFVIGSAMGAAAMSLAMGARMQRDVILATLALTVGICAMHFTGMTAATLTPYGATSDAVDAFNPTSLAIAIAAVAMLVIGMGAVLAMMARHKAEKAQGQALREHVAELEQTRRSLEDTSRDLKDALAAAAQGSEAKSQFLATMSHELRTPLNAIMGYSELIGLQPYGPLGDARYKDYAGAIHSSGAHLLSLINDVLDLARLDANKAQLDEEDVELGELTQSALRLIAPQALKAGVRVTDETPGSLGLVVRADGRRLKQILLNLLSNAVKFTPANGAVTTAVTLGADGVTIAVRDTGIGMRPQDIAVALDRFGQIESAQARKYDGAGLGLPLAKQLAELHGGGLAIESAPGAGTTVRVTLPAARILASSLARRPAA